MRLEEKLRELKQAARKTARESALEKQLEYLRRLEQRPRKALPAKASRSIEHYVEGKVCNNDRGEYFFAQESLPPGRPYGKLRIDDLASLDLRPLELFMPGATLPPPAQVVYLDAETTGLSGGTGTCAFLIGIGAVDASGFRVRQFFLRDFTEEKAALQALAEALEPFQLLVTFNGKTFDLPLLQARYTLARQRSPFTRLTHLDLLHPARRLWKLRLESCNLKNLERKLLGIARTGDVPGSEIPQIYFDYLRTGSAAGLQPVFFHNALDIVTLAALTVEAGQAVARTGNGGDCDSRDLFSLSRILERAGASELSLETCQRALDAGLPDSVEPYALWQLACQHKRQHRYGEAAGLWEEIVRRRARYLIEAYQELAIHYEHRLRDAGKALEYAEAAIEHLRGNAGSPVCLKSFSRRCERLRRKLASSAGGASRQGPGKKATLQEILSA